MNSVENTTNKKNFTEHVPDRIHSIKNTLSKKECEKLIEEAEDILGKTDLTNSEIQKYHPLK